MKTTLTWKKGANFLCLPICTEQSTRSSSCLSLANPYLDFAFPNEHLSQLNQYQCQGSKGCLQLGWSLCLSPKAEVRSLGWDAGTFGDYSVQPPGASFCSFYLGQVFTTTTIPYPPTLQLQSKQNFQHILSVCSSFASSENRQSSGVEIVCGKELHFSAFTGKQVWGRSSVWGAFV